MKTYVVVPIRRASVSEWALLMSTATYDSWRSKKINYYLELRCSIFIGLIVLPYKGVYILEL